MKKKTKNEKKLMTKNNLKIRNKHNNNNVIVD